MTNVARASLEELICDYEDFLRQGELELWPARDPRREQVIDQRFESVDAFSAWVNQESAKTNRPAKEIAANAILVILSVTCALLKRQIDAQAKAFETEGGFTERLYHTRKRLRDNQ